MGTQTNLQCLNTKCMKVVESPDEDNKHVTSATGLACIFWPENGILVLIACVQTLPIKVHTDITRVARGTNVDLHLNLHPYCVGEQSKANFKGCLKTI